MGRLGHCYCHPMYDCGPLLSGALRCAPALTLCCHVPAAGPGIHCLHPHLLCQRHPGQLQQQHRAGAHAAHAFHRRRPGLAHLWGLGWLPCSTARTVAVLWRQLACCSAGWRQPWLASGGCRALAARYQPAAASTAAGACAGSGIGGISACTCGGRRSGGTCSSAGQRAQPRACSGCRMHATCHAAVGAVRWRCACWQQRQGHAAHGHPLLCCSASGGQHRWGGGVWLDLSCRLCFRLSCGGQLPARPAGACRQPHHRCCSTTAQPAGAHAERSQASWRQCRPVAVCIPLG